jgi:hypothetical protein
MSHQQSHITMANMRLAITTAKIATCMIVAIGTPLFSFADNKIDESVASVLVRRCLECHSSKSAKGGLVLDHAEGIVKGGDSGPAIDLTNPSESLLLERIASGEMPPQSRGQSQKIPATELNILRSWIGRGAPWPGDQKLSLFDKTTDLRAGRDWWSLQQLVRPEPPMVTKSTRSNPSQYSNPIDAFILAKLHSAEMQLAPPATKRELIRRAYFDLLGLPPTAEDIDRFVADNSDEAYETLIDHLLQSKHYGERWARHWLDLVRYAETCGYERDQLKPGIWKYRDWVINALNEDMPYDRFLTHQLAGDEVPNRNEQSVIATGMLRAGTWNDEPNDAADYLYTRLEDMVHTTTSAFLGLTVKCARCHDHKFDPLEQEDYYRVASYFWAGHIGQANLGGPTSQQLGYENVFGWTDKGSTAAPINLLYKGERKKPGKVVVPASLSAIPTLQRPFLPPPKDSKTTHRRLQFARWISDPKNPLTSRVMVNRIWLQHFGTGLVRTPNNFGFKSDPPSHPKLLDWLAAEFVEGGWKIKRIHKLIMMSAAYRQSSRNPHREQYEKVDFLNRNYWKFNRRRLDAESLRDSMLATSGKLNDQMGGPSFFPRMSDEALEGLSRKGNAWGSSPDIQRSRRSIYMIIKRSRLLPMMTTFDFSDTTLPCGQRDVSIVAPQALALLNNHFVHEQSRSMAQRVLTKQRVLAKQRGLANELDKDPSNGDPSNGDQSIDDQLKLAWRFALSRNPTQLELAATRAHYQEQLAHFRARTGSQKSKGGSTDANMSADFAVRDKLVLWLRADDGVEVDDDNRVRFWRDAAKPQSGMHRHHASQADPDRRPVLVKDELNGRPALQFDGKKQFLNLAGQLLWSQDTTVFAVASTKSTQGGHREIISNWHRRGRSTNSFFLGTTGNAQIRFSDSFGNAGKLQNPEKPFILSAVNKAESATTYQNSRLLAHGKVTSRVLNGPYVIGTQGNYGTEFWHGAIAEILVYDRALSASQLAEVGNYLGRKYKIESQPAVHSAEYLALTSICHVLLNTNEFIFVD